MLLEIYCKMQNFAAVRARDKNVDALLKSLIYSFHVTDI